MATYSATGNNAIIAQVYRGMLLRLPDEGGFQYWLGQLNSGVSAVNVANAIFVSTEFSSQYGQIFTEQFVDFIYQNMLGRQPDLTSFLYWVDQLKNQGKSRPAFVADLAYSAEATTVLAARYPHGFTTLP